MKARLILENGMIFEGNAFGHLKESVGEVVFTTGMTGYQEVLTDPSYYGQIVTMTYPLIGNYGINLEDSESKSPKVKESESLDEVKEKIEGFSNKEAVKSVSTKNSYTIEGSGKHVAIIDFGIKENIIRNFKKRGCKITVFPMNITAEEVLAVNPDLIFLSNGPGDPEDLTEVIENIKKLVGVKPIVGICLGHQLLALTLGGHTTKLKFGHRGCNHPVKDLERNMVHITSQNHGYVVNELPEDVVATHININDGTIEGMKHTKLPIY